MRLRVTVGESNFCCHAPWLCVWCLAVSVNSFCLFISYFEMGGIGPFFLNLIFYWSKAVRPDFEEEVICLKR